MYSGQRLQREFPADLLRLYLCLLDAGISARRITSALKALGADPTRLSAVLVTHEHTDHVSGLATLTKQLGVPVYATAPTLDRLERKVPALARLGRALEAGTGFHLGELWVESFSTPTTPRAVWVTPSPAAGRGWPWPPIWAT